jgi:hypothetical protein
MEPSQIDIIKPSDLLVHAQRKVIDLGGSDLSNPNKYNEFSAGVRGYESLLSPKLTEEDKKILEEIKNKTKESANLHDKIDLTFQKFDYLNKIKEKFSFNVGELNAEVEDGN